MDHSDIVPTPERARRGIALVPEAIADEDGRPSQPYRSIDTLDRLHNAGAIDDQELAAGEDFARRFRLAQLDPLKAADVSRPVVSGGRYGTANSRIESHRDSVWRAVIALGGMAAPAASCIWHVIGWEMPLNAWAVEQGHVGRQISRHHATGILIAALGVLAKHYEKTS